MIVKKGVIPSISFNMRVLVHFLFFLAGRIGFPVIFNQSLTQMVSPEETREAFSPHRQPKLIMRV